MGQNCEKFLPMCLKSVKGADAIIYCDGGSTYEEEADVWSILEKRGYYFKSQQGCDDKHVIIENKYDQEDKHMNGKQRNFYLDYLKKNHMGEWALVLDADEVLEDFGIVKIKHLIDNVKEPLILSMRIHHFIGDLGHEDSTSDKHYVPHRLFQITEDSKYPLGEHPVLQGRATKGTAEIHMWHLRECLGVFEVQKKHDNNVKKSEIHAENYLDWWHKSMLFGNYPRKRVYYGVIPTPIKKRFGI